MLRSLIILRLLSVVAVAGCSLPHTTCSPNNGIHGVFIMFDGSGTAVRQWDKRLELVEHFKSRFSFLMPIWFIQWSSRPDFCSPWHGDNSSWECYGDRDPCLIGFQEDQGGNCPKSQEELLPERWTEEQYDAAAKRIFEKPQRGWTRPWEYLKNVSLAWIAKKKELRLPENARALVIFHSDGEARDVEFAEEAIKLFKEARLKFFGVLDYSKTNKMDFIKYYPLMDDPEHPDFIISHEFDEALAQKIIYSGCQG